MRSRLSSRSIGGRRVGWKRDRFLLSAGVESLRPEVGVGVEPEAVEAKRPDSTL